MKLTGPVLFMELPAKLLWGPSGGSRGGRSMNKDTVVGIVGACALVAVMIGVFAYEYNSAPDASDLVASTSAGPNASATTNVGASSTQTVELTQTHISNVTFTLTWTAQAAPDTLKLSVEGPNGIAPVASQAEDDGSITLTVPVDHLDADKGAGQWTLTVDFVSAEETSDGLPMGIDNPATEPESDSSVAWTVKTSVEHRILPDA